MSLLTESSETASFVLGGPFFRATTIQLNFNDTSIYIYNDETNDSPITPTLPDYDDSVTYDNTMTVSTDLIYSSSIYMGDN